MFVYHPSSLEQIHTFFEEYIDGISIPYDDFLEGHILESTIYAIDEDGVSIGFFGLLGKMVTIFFISHKYFARANDAFADIKTRFEIKEAFVPTTDIGFLSVALEQYERIEIQAYHFTETDRVVRPPEFSRDHFRLAVAEDLQAIEQLAGDFQDHYPERIASNHIYVLEENGELIGLGVLVDNVIMRHCIGTGMFTSENRRGEGIGRSIILHLREVAHERGKTPVPGCWYYNINSKKTLESAGYITKSKLLKFHF